MSPDELALRTAIVAAPDDDLPRLVYADWLDENGDADRAEFIRLQIDRFRRSATDPTARGISWREYELMEKHELAWRHELPPGLRDGAAFRRGLIRRATCYASELFESHLPIHPIEVLEVFVIHGDADLLDMEPPNMTLPLQSLRINADCGSSIGEPLIQVMDKFGPFDRLSALRIGDDDFGDRGVEALVASNAFPALAVLDLSHCGIGDAGAEALAESAWSRRLLELRLAGNAISPGRWAWLRNRLGHEVVVG